MKNKLKKATLTTLSGAIIVSNIPLSVFAHMSEGGDEVQISQVTNTLNSQINEVSDAQTTFSGLVGIQDVRGYYHLNNIRKQNIPAVELLKGNTGEVLTTSFTLTKEATAYLNFNLTLAGPSDSRVVIKINGQQYLQETVGRGKLSEASFFHLEEGNNLVEIEYHVGSAEEVLSSESWFKLDNMILTEQEVPTRSMEYRVKGEVDWQTYDAKTGIPASLTSKGETLPLEIRYIDTLEIVDVTLTTPKPYAPLLTVEDDGRFYLNHFNMIANEYKSVSVRFNKGKWQTYQSGMFLELIDNECLVDVKVVNEYDEELILPSQHYIFPEGYQPTMNQDMQQPNYIKPLISKVEHFYGLYKTHEDIRFGVSTQANGGSKVATTEWSTDGVTWNPFKHNIDLKFTTAGDYTLLVRATNEDGVVSDVYEQQLTITEAVAPIIEELMFLEPELYVGGEYEPHWQVKHDEGTRLNRLEWGGDYDTMFDTPGEKTITLKAQDTRGLWSDEVSYTFNVLPANKPVVQNLRLDETDLVVGGQYEFKYNLIQDENTEIVDVFWGGDYGTAFDTPGEKTVTLEVMDNRGIWSEVASYTFTVREANAPIIQESSKPNVFVEGEEIKLNYEVICDDKVIHKPEWIEWLSGYPLVNTPGTHQATFRVKDSVGLWSEPYTITYVVTPKVVEPTLKFETLKVKYGSDLDYKSGVTLSKGTATDVKYSLVKDSYNSKKLGKQTVKYELTYKQNGKTIKKTVNRTIEVTTVEPTLKFSTLKVKYGSDLNYKSGVTLSKGSATDVKYSLVKNSYNPKKLGKQTVKYQLTYKQNGKTVKKTVNRKVEVTTVNPTLTFPKTTLTVKYGKTPNFTSGVKLNKGSATNVKYSVVKSSFNAKKRGTQKVKYQITYKQNGKSYKTTVTRNVVVK